MIWTLVTLGHGTDGAGGDGPASQRRRTSGALRRGKPTRAVASDVPVMKRLRLSIIGAVCESRLITFVAHTIGISQNQPHPTYTDFDQKQISLISFWHVSL